MIAFIFTGATMNALLKTELHPNHVWSNWRGSYIEVLPYLRDAFGRAVERIRVSCPSAVARRVCNLVEQLCEPDVTERGHPGTKIAGRQTYALDHVVTELDLLSRRAQIAIRSSP
jgi:hypothetical protein